MTTVRELAHQATQLIDIAKHNVTNGAALDRAGLEIVSQLLLEAKNLLRDSSLLQTTHIPNTNEYLFNWAGVAAIAGVIHSAASSELFKSVSA